MRLVLAEPWITVKYLAMSGVQGRKVRSYIMLELVQLVKTLGCGPRNDEFKSHTPTQYTGLTQLVESSSDTRVVTSSNLVASTIIKLP